MTTSPEPASCVPVAELVKLRDELRAEAEHTRGTRADWGELDPLIASAVPCGEKRLRTERVAAFLGLTADFQGAVVKALQESALSLRLLLGAPNDDAAKLRADRAANGAEMLSHTLARTALSQQHTEERT